MLAFAGLEAVRSPPSMDLRITGGGTGRDVDWPQSIALLLSPAQMEPHFIDTSRVCAVYITQYGLIPVQQRSTSHGINLRIADVNDLDTGGGYTNLVQTSPVKSFSGLPFLSLSMYKSSP